jgi:AcrR family transcriptional regulator
MPGTRDNILDEALRLFAQKGIRETTVRDIARAVGITEGAIYRHFSSKDQIVLELFGRYSSMLYQKIEQAINQSRNDRDRFEGVVKSLLNFAFSNPDAFKFMNIFHYLRGKEVRRFRKIPVVLVRDMLDDMFRREILRLEPDFALAVFIGTIERVFLYKTMGLIKGKRAEIASKTSENLWRFLIECGKS